MSMKYEYEQKRHHDHHWSLLDPLLVLDLVYTTTVNSHDSHTHAHCTQLARPPRCGRTDADSPAHLPIKSRTWHPKLSRSVCKCQSSNSYHILTSAIFPKRYRFILLNQMWSLKTVLVFKLPERRLSKTAWKCCKSEKQDDKSDLVLRHIVICR